MTNNKHTYIVAWEELNGYKVWLTFKHDDGGYDAAIKIYNELKFQQGISKAHITKVLETTEKTQENPQKTHGFIQKKVEIQ